MEGMPRFPAIVPELKEPANGYDDQFVYRLKEYILMHFQADPSDFDKPISEIRNLKSEVMRLHTDVEATCVLKRYYSQLVMMKNRFPMEAGGEVRTPFAWHERALDIPTAQSIDDIGFEMACVMYQIGAVHATIGAMETRQDDDSIKNAFTHFQCAAWPFQYVRDSMDVVNFATSDFDKELLTFHVNILLGQAQECLLEKSLLDHRKPAVVAKLAAYLKELYGQCNRVLLDSNSAIEFVSSKKMKMWSRTCTVKSEIYGCIAMLYMGFQAEEDQKFGERLGYCQAADVHLQRALQVMEKEDRVEMRETVQFVADIVKARLENAKKENDFIYHERIPKVEELLASVEGLGKVRPVAFDPLDPSVGGEDLFGALIPPTVLSAVSQYEEEKAQLKRQWMAKVTEKDDELNSFLASLNSTELGLNSIGPIFNPPELLLHKNAYMNSQIEAVPRLLERLQEVDKLARDADAKLTGLASRLSAIDLPEFTGDEAYKVTSEQIAQLTEHHNRSRSNNGELRRALADHSTDITLLSLPLHELVNELAPRPDVSPASTKEGAKMKQVLDKAHEMQTQRAALVKKLCDELDADNIGKKLLAERDIDNRATFAAELKKHEQTTKYIEMNMTAQANILHHLTEANADFAEQRAIIQENIKARSERVMTLLAAHDIYDDICQKAKEGRRFYEKLLERTDKIGQIVEGLEMAYSQEKEKIVGEKRALEQKMAALKAAKEAREAMNDFGAPQPMGGGGGVPQKAARPRLGDYMDFYRNKMSRNAPVMPQLPQLPPMPAMDSPAYPQQPPSPAPSSIADYSFGHHGEAHTGHGYVLPEAPRHIPPPPQRYAPSYGGQPQRYTPGGYDPRLNPGGPSQPSPTPSQWSNPGYEIPPGPQTPQQQFHQPAGAYLPAQPAGNSHYQYAPPNQPVSPYVPQPSNQPPASAASYQPAQQFSNQPAVPASHQSPQQFNQPAGPVASYQPQPPTTVTSQPTISQQYGQPDVASYQPQQIPNQPAVTAVSYQPLQQFQPPVSPYSSQPAVNPPQLPAVQPPVSPYQPQLPPATVSSQPSVQQMTSQPAAPSYQPQYHPAVQMTRPTVPPPQQQFSSQPAVSMQQSQPGTQQYPGYVPASNQPAAPMSQPVVPMNQPTVPPQQFNQPATSQPAAPITQQPFQGLPQQPFVPAGTNQPPAAKPAVTNVVTSHQPQGQPSVINPQNQNPAPWGAPRPNFQAAGTTASPWHKSGPSPWHQSPTPASSFNQAPPAVPTVPTHGAFPPPPQSTSNVDLLSSLLGDLQLPPAIQPNQMTMAPQMNPQMNPKMAPQMQPVAGHTESLSLQRTAATGSAEAPSRQMAARQVGGMTVVPSASDPSIRPAAAVLPMQQKVQPVVNQEQQMLSMANGSSVSIHPQFFDKPAALSLNEISNPDKFHLGEGDKNRLEKRQLHSAIRGQAPLPSLDPLDPLNQLDAFWSVKRA